MPFPVISFVKRNVFTKHRVKSFEDRTHQAVCLEYYIKHPHNQTIVFLQTVHEIPMNSDISHLRLDTLEFLNKTHVN